MTTPNETSEKTRTEGLQGQRESISISMYGDNLMDAPVWDDREGAKNWLAKLTFDPVAPGGVKSRDFARKSRYDNYYYQLPLGCGVGTALEFGADYYYRSNRRLKNRWCGVIVEKEKERIIMERYPSAGEAAKAGIELKHRIKKTDIEALLAETAEKSYDEMTLDELKARLADFKAKIERNMTSQPPTAPISPEKVTAYLRRLLPALERFEIDEIDRMRAEDERVIEENREQAEQMEKKWAGSKFERSLRDWLVISSVKEAGKRLADSAVVKASALKRLAPPSAVSFVESDQREDGHEK